jgi:hypothetical protein
MVSPVHGDYRRCQAEIPLIVLCRFPGPALKGAARVPPRGSAQKAKPRGKQQFIPPSNSEE